MKLHALTIGFSIFAMSSHALAQGEAPAMHGTIRFTYAASDTCPTKSEFAGLVKDRGVVIPESDSAPRALSIGLNADPAHPGKWRGSLQIKDGTYLGSEKSTEGATCADVAHSLAIFTAIALTPDSAAQPSAPATGAASTTSASPTSEAVSPASTAADPTPPAPPKDTYSDPDFENAPTLHRHRFTLAADAMVVLPVLQTSSADGIGIAARYYFSERLGLKLDADFIRSHNDPAELEYGLTSNGTPTTYDKPESEIGGKGMLSAEFVLNRAVGTLAEGHIDLRRIPADLVLDAGVGAVWTRPVSLNDPTFRTFSYQPDLAVQVGWGARIFITRSLAVNFGTEFTMYNAKQESTVVASTQAARSDQSTWYANSAIQGDITVRTAFEVLF